jgi:integration host factor subunit beta
MNQLELVEALKNKTGISKSEAKAVVKLFFDNMADALINGNRVEIRGMCSFFVKNYKGYLGRNPKTGEKLIIPPKKQPYFKAGKALKKIVDN